jgi:hypothetical protein
MVLPRAVSIISGPRSKRQGFFSARAILTGITRIDSYSNIRHPEHHTWQLSSVLLHLAILAIVVRMAFGIDAVR